MSQPAFKLRPPMDGRTVLEPMRRPDVVAASAAPERDVAELFADPSAELEDDPHYYGWRDQWETSPDGSEKLRRIPLTYEDLLDPQEEDFVAESTIHHMVSDYVAQVLKQRYKDEPTIAVWSNLKICFEIPGLTTGPGPDVCVVAGVEDRERERASFRFGEEPGKVRLVVEVVSQKSLRKDYEDLLPIYARLGVEEYVAIRPRGFYVSGPFQVRGWRREAGKKRLRRIVPDQEGRLHLQTLGVRIGTGPQGWDLLIWDAATGERLRTPEEQATCDAAQETAARRQAEERAELAQEHAAQEIAARRQAEERAELAQEHAAQETAARRKAEERAELAEDRADQEAAARRQAEERHSETLAEIERLRAQLQGHERRKRLSRD